MGHVLSNQLISLPRDVFLPVPKHWQVGFKPYDQKTLYDSHMLLTHIKIDIEEISTPQPDYSKVLQFN